jgi:type II secretory pathway predicted ATPase ExeA
MPVIHENTTEFRYAVIAACHHHAAKELMSGAVVGDLGGEKTRKQPS